MLTTQARRSDQIGASFPASEIDFLRSEHGADVLQHRERFAARSGFRRVVAGQADQPLILALVVPMREEHRHESKRIEVLARGSTFLRVNRVELEERPALGFLRRDR